MEKEEKNKSEINNTENNNENNNQFLDKVYKFITKEKREIIGYLKAYNKEGNFYLSDCVEVFDKNSDHYATNDLFQNNDEHKFFYESDNYQYQYINSYIFPLEEIGEIYMLKDEIFNKYKLMIDKYTEEKKKEEEQKKIEEEQNKINENVGDNNNDEFESNENILKSIREEKKIKKKKKKKNK